MSTVLNWSQKFYKAFEMSATILKEPTAYCELTSSQGTAALEDFKISINSGNIFLFSSFKNTIAIPSSPNLDALIIWWMYSLMELCMSNTITCLTDKRSTPRSKTPVVLNLCCFQSYDAPRTQPLYGKGWWKHSYKIIHSFLVKIPVTRTITPLLSYYLHTHILHYLR